MNTKIDSYVATVKATPRVLCLATLLLVGTNATAQGLGGRITFTGRIVESTGTAHADEAGTSVGQDAPHRTTQQAIDAMANKDEFLEYFAQHWQAAGVSSDRLRLTTKDYL